MLNARSNKGAPGVDGEDFADIDAYGVQRWLGELALALRQDVSTGPRSLKLKRGQLSRRFQRIRHAKKMALD